MSRVGEVALKQALKEVEDDARGAVVDTDDGTTEGERQAIEIADKPGASISRLSAYIGRTSLQHRKLAFTSHFL